MRLAIVGLALSAIVAHANEDTECSTQIKAQFDGRSHTVGPEDDGEIRGGISSGSFFFDSGFLLDWKHDPCGFKENSGQLFCGPDFEQPGWKFEDEGSDNILLFEGSPTFWQCTLQDLDREERIFNIHRKLKEDSLKGCTPINLRLHSYEPGPNCPTRDDPPPRLNDRSVGARDDRCLSQYRINGDAHQLVGQIGSGQVRSGPNIPPKDFSLTRDGRLYDKTPDPCGWVAPSFLLQCGPGQRSDTGFNVEGDGTLTWQGSPDFFECETDVPGQRNVYRAYQGAQCRPVRIKSDRTVCNNWRRKPAGRPKARRVRRQAAATTDARTITLSVKGRVPDSPVGPIKGGQIRHGDGIDQKYFQLDRGEETLIVDGTHGCGFVEPAGVLRCGLNQAPSPGFSVDPETNKLFFEHQSVFFQCETSEKNQFNIYNKLDRDPQCVPINIFASSVSGGDQTPVPELKIRSEDGCGTDLIKGQFEFPHQMVRIDAFLSDLALGNFDSPLLSSSHATIFNFDIPPEDAGKQCSIVFRWPSLTEISTENYRFKGDTEGGDYDDDGLFAWFRFAETDPADPGTTTWDNSGGDKLRNKDVFRVGPGDNRVIRTIECPADGRIAFEMTSFAEAGLEFFQDAGLGKGRHAFGLFITKC